MEEEALKYVAGYVAFRFKDKYNTLGSGTKHKSSERYKLTHIYFTWKMYISFETMQIVSNY